MRAFHEDNVSYYLIQCFLKTNAVNFVFIVRVWNGVWLYVFVSVMHPGWWVLNETKIHFLLFVLFFECHILFITRCKRYNRKVVFFSTPVPFSQSLNMLTQHSIAQGMAWCWFHICIQNYTAQTHSRIDSMLRRYLVMNFICNKKMICFYQLVGCEWNDI